MATKTKTRTDDKGSGRALQHRHLPFSGLLAMVPIAMLVGWVLNTQVNDTARGLALTTGGIALLTSGITLVAYAAGEDRRPLVRWHVTVSVFLAGTAEAVTVAIGMPFWWGLTFGIGGVFLASSWALYRLDALRRDEKEDSDEKSGIVEKLKNYRFRKVQPHYDQDGDLARIEVDVDHLDGETAEALQGAVANLESATGSPRGRSRAVPSQDQADKSKLVLVTKDVLKGLVPYPGPSAPGCSITCALVTGVYEDQELVRQYRAGGSPEAPNPASKGWMGMTRTGKTMNAQVETMEMMSRSDVTIWWFDTVKGAQTVRPLRRGLDVIIASDDPGAFRRGMTALTRLIRWRADKLGECGYRAWTPEAATDPRLRMPFLVPHFEEADVLCELAGDELVFIASKGLSVGVSTGISLQRADHTSMPTGLRFNIGNWSVFGCGDDISAGFALSDATIDAGAHPEYWKQSKPGYHYTEGIGIDQERYPVPAKSYIAGDDEMEAHANEWGPRMMPLDKGSVQALGAWYDQAKADTHALVARWDGGTANPTPAAPTSAPVGEEDEDARIRAEVDEEVDDVGEELRRDGTYDGIDEATHGIDPREPIPPTRPDGVSWSIGQPAPSREVAIKSLQDALLAIADGPVPTGSEENDDWVRREGDWLVFAVTAIAERYPFRARPWFSEALKDMAAGGIPTPGIVLEKDSDSGGYRLRRTPGRA